MTIALPTGMPERFAAGTTLEYLRSYPDFAPSGGWSIKLYLAGPDGATDVNGSNVADQWQFAIDPVTSASITPGLYRWVERATNGSQIIDVNSGLVTVTRDIAQAQPGDLLSFEEKQLAAVEAAIEARVAGGQLENYQLAGRAASKWSMKELIAYRDELKARIARMKNGGRVGRQHLFEFRRAS